jgi:hypothetical protein
LTFSSNTAELHAILPHINSHPLILLTARTHTIASPNPILALQPRQALSVLLPTPVPVPEAQLFGVSAPTTSTTVTLALCDALAIAAANALHGNLVEDIFKKHHPGGAIGIATKRERQEASQFDAEASSNERMEMG